MQILSNNYISKITVNTQFFKCKNNENILINFNKFSQL